jgi:hypothetical protein
MIIEVVDSREQECCWEIEQETMEPVEGWILLLDHLLLQ